MSFHVPQDLLLDELVFSYVLNLVTELKGVKSEEAHVVADAVHVCLHESLALVKECHDFFILLFLE